MMNMRNITISNVFGDFENGKHCLNILPLFGAAKTDFFLHGDC